MVVNPITTREFESLTKDEFEAAARADVEIEVVSLDEGPPSIESRYEEELAARDILRKVERANAEGYDAVIINCFGDPAVGAAREISKIPVVGPGEASFLLACCLGQNFSVVTMVDSLVPVVIENLRRLGLSNRLASIRALGIPVLELMDRARVKSALLEISKKAVREDRAQVIVLGCTGLVGLAAEVQRELGVPVVDPAIASLKLAEALVDMKLSPSKAAYAKYSEGAKII